MIWRRSILMKMLVGMLAPIIAVFLVAGIFISYLVQNSISQVTTSQLSAKSEGAAAQVSEFFTRYIETVEQMAVNQQVIDMMTQTAKGRSVKEAPSYSVAAKTFDNILANDPDTVALVWTADFDSGESARSGGAVRGLPDYDITTRSWYAEMMEKKSVFITEPYIDSTTGNIVTSVAAPVTVNGQMIGLVALDLTIDELNDMMSQYKLGESGFFVLSSAQGTLIYHPDSELVGKPIAEASLSENVMQAVTARQAGMYEYSTRAGETVGALSVVGSTGWTVLTGLPLEEFAKPYSDVRNMILMIFALGLLALIVTVALISVSVIKPLKQLETAANKIADGDLEVTVDIRSKDETGRVAVAISRTVDRLKDYIKYIEEIVAVLGQIGDGRMDFSLTYDYVGDFAAVKTALLRISETLTVTLSQINTAANQVAIGSDQMSSGAQALSQGAIAQSSSVEALSNAIAQVSAQIADNAGQAEQANALCAVMSEGVELSNRRMGNTVEAMNEISTNSMEIKKIIKSIDDIAFQTNILALNAAVEAARAGAAGKGFAVVADEVRNLAGKSALAAKNTQELIEKAIATVAKGTGAADETARSLADIVSNVQQINGMLGSITHAAGEQANAARQITDGVKQISSVVQQNSATAEQSAAASEELSSQAQMLKTLVSGFRLKEKEYSRYR